eukprot:433367-Rhodomonas_salina.1
MTMPMPTMTRRRRRRRGDEKGAQGAILDATNSAKSRRGWVWNALKRRNRRHHVVLIESICDDKDSAGHLQLQACVRQRVDECRVVGSGVGGGLWRGRESARVVVVWGSVGSGCLRAWGVRGGVCVSRRCCVLRGGGWLRVQGTRRAGGTLHPPPQPSTNVALQAPARGCRSQQIRHAT